MTVTFFGHKDTPNSIKQLLEETISFLIEHQGTDIFYVGNNGNFDRLVISVLKKISLKYNHIKYYVVLAYRPKNAADEKFEEIVPTIRPEEVALSIPKYAISKRNDWMIKQCDTVITYVSHSFGGAAKFQEKARKKGKSIINLAEL